MKRLLLVLTANAAALIAFWGISTTSWGSWYQPEIPQYLKKSAK